MKKMFNLKSLLLLLTLMVGMNAWAEELTGTIKFGSNDVKINGASVTGDDDLGNTWTITTAGTTSFTANTAYYQVGSSKNPATSITFTTSLPASANIKSVSASFGGFSGTAGTVTFKVGETAIGTGSLNASNDVTVTSTTTATGDVITVTVTNIAKGVKVYNITYTMEVATPTVNVTAPTFDVAAGTYTEDKRVLIDNYNGDYMYAFTLDGTVPAFDENLDVTNGTLYNENEGIEITSSCTLKAIAVDIDGNKSSVTSATYTINKPIVFASLEDLAAADLTSGTLVTVSFTDAEIKSFYTTSSGYRNGVYFNIQKGGKDIEIYYQNVPAEWVVNGTLSGTMTCPWKLYSGTWELAPDANTWSWTNLTYTAPVAKETATITAEPKTSLEVGEYDEYVVTYDGDGVLSVASSDETVAEAIIDDNTVLVSALKAGTTTITISAPATANYYAASKTYTLTVTAKASIPFTFNGGKSAIASTPGVTQTGLGTDYSSDPKLKFDNTGDNLVINYNGSAKVLKYTIKGNPATGETCTHGTYDVMESADGETYTSVRSYTELEGTTDELAELKSDSRFVKFVYTKKIDGNVALGNISITDGYVMDVAAGEFRTLCLPNAATVVGADVYSIAGTYMNGSAVAGVALEAVNGNLVAGTPYIIETTDAKVFAAYTGEAVAEPVSATGLVGNLSDTPVTVANGNYVIGADNKLHKVAGAHVTVGQNRAYINLNGVEEYTGAAAKVMGVYDVEATGINNVEALGENAVIYNVAGQRVAQPVKGINVINGRKVVIK